MKLTDFPKKSNPETTEEQITKFFKGFFKSFLTPFRNPIIYLTKVEAISLNLNLEKEYFTSIKNIRIPIKIVDIEEYNSIQGEEL